MADEAHLPVDPQLVLPDSVRRGAADADAMIAALKGSTAIVPPGTPPVQPPQPPPGSSPPGSQPSPPAAFGEMVTADLQLSAPTNPSASFDLNGTGTQAPPQGQPQQASPQEPPQDYEQMYRSLRGRWDSEVPQLRQSVQAMMDRTSQLETLLAGVGTRAPVPNGNGNGGGNGHGNPQDEFSPEEIEQWGPETLEMLGKIIDRRAGRMASAQVQPLVHNAEQQAQAQMERLLDNEVPQWREINFHPEFMNWALLPDRYTGAIRRDLLKRAYAAKNGVVVANFFKGFLSEVPPGPVTLQPPAGNAPAPPAQPQQGQAGPQPPASNRIALADLAAPSGAGATASGAPPPPVQKRMYRGSDIARFYSDKALGKYNTPQLAQQAAAVEADIFAAQSEGRVIAG